MPRASRRAAVTISPRDFRRRMKSLFIKDYPKHYDKFIDEMSKEGVRIMKAKVPVRSGTLRNSIQISKKQKKGGGADRRANVHIGPTVFYGKYVDQGTGSSSGRFVPELGRRVKSGTHPGIRGRNFISATARDLQPKIEKFYKLFTINPFRRAWNQRLRPGRG